MAAEIPMYVTISIWEMPIEETSSKFEYASCTC